MGGYNFAGLSKFQFKVLIRYGADSSEQEEEQEVGQENLAGAAPSNISHVQWIVEAVLIVI